MKENEKTNIQSVDTWKTLKKLIAFIKPYWLLVFFSLVASMISAGVNLYIAEIIDALTEIILKKQYSKAMYFIYIMIALIVIGVSSSYIIKFASGRFSIYTIRDIRSRIYSHIEKIKLDYIENNHTGEIVSRMTNNISQLQDYLESNVSSLIYEPLVFLGAIILLLNINWKMTLVSTLAIAVTFVLASVIILPIQRRVRELQTDIAKVNSIYQDNIRGIYIVKAYNIYKQIFTRYETALTKTLNKSLSIEKPNSLLTAVSIILSVVPILVSITYGGYLAVQGELKPGSILAFIYLLDLLTTSSTTVINLLSNFRSTIGVTSHLFEILEQPVEREGGATLTEKDKNYPILFENVTFSYNNNMKVLDQINFKIEKGKTVALVGSSGSGKSTIIKLLCGFYQPQEGKIKLYGSDISELDLNSVRSKIALVSQDVYLFPTTVAENIAGESENISFDEIEQAAKIANAHEFISKLHDGYNTLVTERGTSLSGGQRQRIVLARAILKKAPILLLDEPTSALDTQSEMLVQEALERIAKFCTVIIVAHRLTTIKNADEIIVLDKGRIIENGSHHSLMKEGKVYRQLYQKQFLINDCEEKILEKGGESVC